MADRVWCHALLHHAVLDDEGEPEQTVCMWPLAGVKVLDPSQYSSPEKGAAAATAELKQTLEGLAAHLFGSGIEVCVSVCASLG